MKRNITRFFQIVIVLIGIGTLAFMLWEPHLEGRNAHATLFEIYFKDPFLACAYIASISFFVALYQIFKLLGLIGRNEVYSQAAVKALRTVKYCALVIIAFVVAAEVYFFTIMRGKDDIAGGVAMGLFVFIISALVATFATVFEKRVQKLLV